MQSEPYIDQLVAQQAWRFMDGMGFHPYSGVLLAISLAGHAQKQDGAKPDICLQTHLDHRSRLLVNHLNPVASRLHHDQNARGQVLVSLMDRLKAWE